MIGASGLLIRGQLRRLRWWTDAHSIAFNWLHRHAEVNFDVGRLLEQGFIRFLSLFPLLVRGLFRLVIERSHLWDF